MQDVIVRSEGRVSGLRVSFLARLTVAEASSASSHPRVVEMVAMVSSLDF